METPIIDGNKKKINTVKPLNNPVTHNGEFTINDEPVVTVKASKIPAEPAERNNAIIKNIAA